MAELGYYNRLDRTPIEIAHIAIEDRLIGVTEGYILVRKTSDGSQSTYDVRYYLIRESVPSFMTGILFKITPDGLVSVKNKELR